MAKKFNYIVIDTGRETRAIIFHFVKKQVGLSR